VKRSLILGAIIFFGLSSVFAQDLVSKREEGLKEALKGLKMTRKDLSFRDDYTLKDTFRLKIIDDLMKSPLLSLDYSDSVALLLSSSKSFLNRLVRTEYQTKGDEITVSLSDSSPILGELETGGSLQEEIEYLLEKNGQEISSDEKEQIKEQIEKLPKETGECLRIALSSLRRADEKLDGVFSVLNQEEMEQLENYVSTIILEDVEDQNKTPEELDLQAKIEEKMAEDLIPLASKIDVPKINRIGAELADRMWYVKERLKQFLNKEENKGLLEKTYEDSNILFYVDTPEGEIVIGGFGRNLYVGKKYLIIDLGGDDQYFIPEIEEENEANSSVIIDLEGADLYKAQRDYCFGSGFFGFGILFDCQGDDEYLAKSFSLGAGLFGVGILVDEEGNDKYVGDTYTQGAGGFGIGILEDQAGNDFYSGCLYAQGFGFVKGLGGLVDLSGNDNYFAGGKYKDIIRYQDHFISLSQGFAYGIRPILSGGIGILVDLSGNDTYTSDIFGQGSSYWWSLGALVDFSGNDNYISYQYAQGAATHMTLGCLIDIKGNDNYISHGVSQGCGHDYSSGILEDREGDDNYITFGLSQGAGNANGIGIIIDHKGNDKYVVGQKIDTQGYGDGRREFGSIGIFLDMSGRDEYIGGYGKDSTWWNTPSSWGIGIDEEFQKESYDKNIENK
jgi:hypothetical protein